jgi:hypothetical protein
MEYNKYLSRYFWRVNRLLKLGMLYPRKCWWRLTPYNKVEWREVQLAEMLRVIRQLEKEAKVEQ